MSFEYEAFNVTCVIRILCFRQDLVRYVVTLYSNLQFYISLYRLFFKIYNLMRQFITHHSGIIMRYVDILHKEDSE